MRKLIVDGIPVEVDDTAAAVIERLQVQAKDSASALSDAQTKVGELTATISTKDGEIAALTQQVADAALTPEKLDAAVQARGEIVGVAKAILGDSFDPKGKTDGDIKRAVVAKSLDAAALAAMDDNGVNGAYAVLAKSASTVKDGVRESVLADGLPVNVSDAKAARDEARKKAQAETAAAYL